MKNEDLYVYKKSDFYEDYISSQKEYYEREQVDTLLAEKDREIALLKERICNGDVSRLTWIDDCIAKDKEIAEQKDKLQNVSELLKQTREWLIESQKLHKRCADNAIKTIRHQKYKQCMAMAKWCENALLGWMGYKESFSSHQRYIKVMLFTKWQKRWLALAEKFKEAK